MKAKISFLQTTLQMKTINTFLVLLFAASTLMAQQAEETIDYEISSGTVNTQATGTIRLVPGAWIRPGVVFSAAIVTAAPTPPNAPIAGVSYPYAPIALSSSENYVFTRAYQVEKTTPAGFVNEGDVIESVTYFDGLGRPLQSIQLKASPDRKDMLVHMSYDDFARSDKQWLPIEMNDTQFGVYRGDQESAIESFYGNLFPDDFVGTPNPYSETLFEDSPLARVLEQGAPGTDWKIGNGHEIKMQYKANIANEVYHFSVGFTGGDYKLPTLIGVNDQYPAGQLMKSVVKDENHDGSTSKLHTVEEFTNKLGQMILKRTYALVNGSVEAHDTYYVYDDFGNLTFVLPPKVNPLTVSNSSTERNELCYQYVFDEENRLIKKKIPGKGWEEIVYDKLDRPILTQDANLAEDDKWLFTKYDAFGRVVYTGIKVSTSNRQTLQNGADVHAATFEQRGPAVDKGGITIYYTDNTYPSIDFTNNGSDQILTVNYYDSYVDQDGLSIPSSNSFSESTTSFTQGLATVSKVRVLDHDDWITTINGYDDEGRVVYSASKNNYLNTTDISESNLDFSGKVLESKSSHTRDSNTPVITNEYFTYDHMARPLTHQQAINANPWTILSSLEYDQIGQNTLKHVGNSLQTVDYKYNVRGWLKSINDPNNLGDDLFAFKINYNDPQNFGAGENPEALFNGNISQTIWNSASVNNTGNPVSNRYSYTYDALNRITSAIDDTSDQRYSLTNIEYDKNGNIQKLKRNGHTNNVATAFGVMDDLTYSYTGNQLQSVTDIEASTGFLDGNANSTDYTYDANANIKSDVNKGITNIEYNYLNLPTKVTVNGNESGTIDYVYSADGVKLKKTISTTGIETLYANGYLYEGNTLQFFPQTEGYVSLESGSYKYVYNYKDHIGNVRLSYTDANGDGSITTNEIVKENNYYPFGMTHKGYNNNVSSLGNSVAKKFMFGGKEYQDELGIAWMDFGARNYDASLGRWMNTDPLEQFHSPYVYAGNDPIRYMDPTGMYSTEEWKKDNGITDNDLATVYESPKDEYDKDGNKISNLGGDETDFYHQENGSTKVVNRKSKESNTISGGESIIKDYTQRNGKTSFWAIFDEFMEGTGPEKSVMYGKDHQMNQGIINSYQFFRAAKKFLASDKDKMKVKGTFGIFGAIRSGPNGVEQMMGKANISMYKLGDNIVFVVTDSKSRSSWSLNPFDGDEVNVSRQEGKIIPKSNTHQTYIFSLTTKQTNDAIETYDIGHGEF